MWLKQNTKHKKMFYVYVQRKNIYNMKYNITYIIIIASSILRLKTSSNKLQQFKYKRWYKQYFTIILKNWKKIKQKFKTVFIQQIYPENLPPFHMYNLKENRSVHSFHKKLHLTYLTEARNTSLQNVVHNS